MFVIKRWNQRTPKIKLYIDPEYIEITKSIYKKGKVRSWFWKQGMTYKQLNKRAIDVFEHTDNI
jgi:hypothetical protein